MRQRQRHRLARTAVALAWASVGCMAAYVWTGRPVFSSVAVGLACVAAGFTTMALSTR